MRLKPAVAGKPDSRVSYNSVVNKQKPTTRSLDLHCAVMSTGVMSDHDIGREWHSLNSKKNPHLKARKTQRHRKRFLSCLLSATKVKDCLLI